MSLKNHWKDMETYWRRLEILNSKRGRDREALSIVCHPEMPLFVNRYFDFFQKRAVKQALLAKEIAIKDKIILDVGCGGGRWADLFSQYGAKVTGIDIQEKTIQKNRELFPAIDFKVMSSMNLDFQDNYFDLLSSITVLQHLPGTNQIESVNEIVRVIKQGGYLLILEWTRQNEASHMFPLHSDEWIKLFNERGLSLEYKKDIGYDLLFRAFNKFTHSIRNSLGMTNVKPDDIANQNIKISVRWRIKLKNILSLAITLPSYPLELLSVNLLSEILSTHTLMIFRKH